MQLYGFYEQAVVRNSQLTILIIFHLSLFAGFDNF